jgi:hypothetical protein
MAEKDVDEMRDEHERAMSRPITIKLSLDDEWVNEAIIEADQDARSGN